SLGSTRPKDGPMTKALRSTLPADVLTSHGTHRYFSDIMSATSTMVHSLMEGDDPVFAIESTYNDGFMSRWHSHTRGQISFVQNGTMTIIGETYSLIVPAGHAIWIPPGHMHQATASGEIAILGTYVDARHLPALPDVASVLHVSDMFEPLLKRLIAFQLMQRRDEIRHALVLLMFDELRASRPLNVSAPMPQEKRLRRVCEAILKDPTISNRKEELARIGTMSVRTMTRLFRSELGLTYSEWVQTTLAFSAISRLAAGQSVAQVAGSLGYTSPSAFTAMFRRRFGICPSDVASGRRGSFLPTI
ncbi:MAG: helix-turn-helix transcriptional regulator, partial [Pseudomonadota bacterium]|nr:helix-turn-helix transcriptional regulator [Pseudomonadota bacterium]